MTSRIKWRKNSEPRTCKRSSEKSLNIIIPLYGYPDLKAEDCMKNHAEIFKFLLTQGANTDFQKINNKGNSPMTLLKRDKSGTDGASELARSTATSMLAHAKEHAEKPNVPPLENNANCSKRY
jgi:hypothetical protein